MGALNSLNLNPSMRAYWVVVCSSNYTTAQNSKRKQKKRKKLESGQDRGFIPLNTIPLSRILEMKERGRIGRSTFNMCFSVCTFLFDLLTIIFAVSMQFQTSTMLHKLLK
jgi:hypothetical protein